MIDYEEIYNSEAIYDLIMPNMKNYIETDRKGSTDKLIKVYNNGELEIIDQYNTTIIAFYKEDKLHREGLPAKITFDKYDGKIIRSLYYQNGKLYNPNGPSKIVYSLGKVSNISFTNKDGAYNRFDGPAVISFGCEECVDCRELYFINGINYSNWQYDAIIKCAKEDCVFRTNNINTLISIRDAAKFYKNDKVVEKFEEKIMIKKLSGQF